MHRFDRCLIHAGMPKTGSTSLQTFFAVNRKALLARGALYPASLGWRNHVRLAAALHPAPTPQLKLAITETGAADADGLRAQLADGLTREVADACAEADAAGRKRPGTLLLSSEFFWSMPDGVALLRALADWVAERAVRAETLIYLRRQDAFAVSMASTRARDGEPGEGFAAPIFPTTPRRAYRYPNCLAGFRDAFGRDAVTLRLFDPSDLIGGDVICDALSVWDLGPEDGLIRPPRRNPSLRPAMQAWLGHLATLDQARYGRGANAGARDDKVDLSAVIERHGGRGRRPSQEEADAFMQKFADGNERVRVEWFAGRAQLFNDDRPWPKDADPPPSAADLMAVTHDALLVKEAEIACLNARLAMAEGRTVDALAGFARSARLNPGVAATALAWGEAALSGDADADGLRLSAADVARALDLCGGGEDPRTSLRLLLGRLQLGAGDHGAALATAQALADDRPRLGRALHLAADVRKAAFRAGRGGKATDRSA
jgi:hypothetical protein